MKWWNMINVLYILDMALNYHCSYSQAHPVSANYSIRMMRWNWEPLRMRIIVISTSNTANIQHTGYILISIITLPVAVCSTVDTFTTNP